MRVVGAIVTRVAARSVSKNCGLTSKTGVPSDAEPKARRAPSRRAARVLSPTYTRLVCFHAVRGQLFAPFPSQAQLTAAGEAHEARRQAAPKQTAHDKLPFRLLMEDSPGQMWSPNGFVNVVKHPKQRRPRPVDDDDY